MRRKRSISVMLLLLVVIVFLCKAAGDEVEDSIDNTDNNNHHHTPEHHGQQQQDVDAVPVEDTSYYDAVNRHRQEKAQAKLQGAVKGRNTPFVSRPFYPVLTRYGEPGQIEYYTREESGDLAVRYYDPMGLFDFGPVPRHFPDLPDDRVVYELQWNAVQTAQHKSTLPQSLMPIGNWTERTILEIVYHSLMEDPIRDYEALFDEWMTSSSGKFHPKAAVKQQQRQNHHQLQTLLAGGAPASMSTHRRTYQQHLRENAIAAAAAHRAGKSGSSTASASSSSSSGVGSSSTTTGDQASPTTIPPLVRKMETAYGWLRDDVDICKWEGVVCEDYSATSQYFWNGAEGGIMTTRDADDDGNMPPNLQPERYTCEHCPDPPYERRVTKLELPYAGLVGTLPPEIAVLQFLNRLDLRGNRIYGSLPTTLHTMSYLQYLDLTRNELTGTFVSASDADAALIPPDTRPRLSSFPPHIREIWLGSNQFHGTIPLDWRTPLLMFLDLGKNLLTGSLPRYGRKQMPKLKSILLEDNQLTGKLPPKWVGMTDLEILDVGGNALNSTIPTSYGTLTNLREFNIVGNMVTGTIPTELLKLTQLESLMLSENSLRGPLPGGDDTVPHRAMREPEAGYKWSQLSQLQFLHVNDNYLTSTLPPDFFYSLSDTLQSLDISYNEITGTIPREIAKCSLLERINLQANLIGGSMPSDMSRMNPNIELNFTNNLLTGSIPNMFCGGGPTSMNFLYRQFGCDAVLCPPKTFHPTGAATLHSGCRRCPTTTAGEKSDPPESKLLGRTQCHDTDITVLNGDVDGDGVVSPREALRLLFVETIGRFWGQHFQNWIDLVVNECDLYGVTCINGDVAKLDLVNAAMCSNGEQRSGLVPDCRGIPTEIALLSRLGVLALGRQQFLMGTIPSEIGLMTSLKYIDISECPYMSGPLPSELGLLTYLKIFNIIGSSFNECVPSEIFHLTSLEKLHLSNNVLTGTLPPNSIGQMANLKELFYSNNYIQGTIPRETGNLSKLENIEMYGNELNGTIPDTLSRCTNLKRIDVFSNLLTGSIPKQLANIESLQIMHLKMNRLTGTIPASYGELPYLSWFDVSHNQLHGTIPATFGQSRSIKDFRLGGNMFYDPVPPSLCTNTNVNGGFATIYGCDGVICPLGTYSESGHATPAEKGCKKCPENETTMYLGSTECRAFAPEDILAILFDAMQGERWPEELRGNWKNRHIDVCYWSGVICDSDGDIVSIGFPIAWDDWANDGMAKPMH